MIYNRNKESFKKTTHKVHSHAQSNILALVKDIMGQKAEQKLPENIEKNIPPQPAIHKIVIENQKNPVPKLCQSKYETSQSVNLTLEHLFDFTFKSSHNSGSSAHQQYAELLQAKIEELEQEVRLKDRCIKDMEEKQKQREENLKNGVDGEEDKDRLQRFYHDARNCLVLMCAEMIECKQIIIEHKNEEKLKAINSILNKSEELLEVNRGLIEMGRERKECHEQDFSQLKETCLYQQKTIDFLRKSHPNSQQFNEVKLLRHEINRISSENQKLIKKLHSKIKVATPVVETAKEIVEERRKMQESRIKVEENIQSLRKQVVSLKTDVREKNDLVIKYKEEKQCLIQFLDEARSKTEQQSEIIRNLENQISGIKAHSNSSSKKIHLDSEKGIVTTEDLMKALKPYPRYQKLLMSIVSLYEQKISLLQEKVIEERMIKDKFMEWSKSVYGLLEKANISAQVVEAHMQELYCMDKKMDNSRIEKLLRQIRSLSVGIDRNDVEEMENELDQYIVSLKNRNQVIKEVDFEDGSSVALSETFTDQDFEE